MVLYIITLHHTLFSPKISNTSPSTPSPPGKYPHVRQKSNRPNQRLASPSLQRPGHRIPLIGARKPIPKTQAVTQRIRAAPCARTGLDEHPEGEMPGSRTQRGTGVRGTIVVVGWGLPLRWMWMRGVICSLYTLISIDMYSGALVTLLQGLGGGPGH